MEQQTVYEVERRESPLSDDTLIQVAAMAEKRIEAVIKIKQMALKVTNAGDWVDQDGRPYLMASGAEKIGNLFNISWRFLEPEPDCEVDPDGHYTYTYKGEFNMGGRSIQVDGSRSSKDGFFKQYNWKGDVKTEKEVGDRDNKRDVKMAALTNLLGNGITRILGIRNLTYEDLDAFAGIQKGTVKGVKYDKKAPITQPARASEKKNGSAPPDDGKITENQGKRFFAIASGAKKSKEEIESFLYAQIASKHTGDIPKARYDELCTLVTTWTPGDVNKPQVEGDWPPESEMT